MCTSSSSKRSRRSRIFGFVSRRSPSSLRHRIGVWVSSTSPAQARSTFGIFSRLDPSKRGRRRTFSIERNAQRRLRSLVLDSESVGKDLHPCVLDCVERAFVPAFVGTTVPKERKKRQAHTLLLEMRDTFLLVSSGLSFDSYANERRDRMETDGFLRPHVPSVDRNVVRTKAKEAPRFRSLGVRSGFHDHDGGRRIDKMVRSNAWACTNDETATRTSRSQAISWLGRVEAKDLSRNSACSDTVSFS